MLWVILLLAAVVVLGILFLIWQDNDVTLKEFTAAFPTLPREFDGFRIVQVSDLHNKWFGKDQKRLMDKVRKASPDIIVITGDLIDKRRTLASTLSPALCFVRQAVETAPVYFASGNHEAMTKVYETLKKYLDQLHVINLDDRSVLLSRGDSQIALLGLACIATELYEQPSDDAPPERWEMLSRLQKEREGAFQILLSHRPDWMDLYQHSKIPLIFSGHAHGGQVYLPLIGALYAPNQGLFPKYTAGLYSWEGGTMCVSRGLGNSRFPFRVFNRPQVVCVTLKKE